MKKDYYKIHEKEVLKYQAGLRDNPMICTNGTIAKKLMKNLSVKLERREPVNKKMGLFMYEIIS